MRGLLTLRPIIGTGSAPDVNDLIVSFGLEGWKPIISALLLPPLPLLLLILAGARLMFRQRLLAWALILLSCAALWTIATPAFGKWMRATVFPVPAALGAERIAEMRRQTTPIAIVVLGGGRRELAPEYGVSSLSLLGLERLRYATWLARQTRWPMLFSGGLGHGSKPGATEAEIAARIAEREFGQPIRWLEDRSRDTTENALLSVPLLREHGVQRIVLVTHDLHMRRALRAFERAAQRDGLALQIVPAPVGLQPAHHWESMDFLPGRQGWFDSQVLLHEMFGYWLGA
jgi:uncharacterized SAM-binding protein YcdF (DUF218 family)